MGISHFRKPRYLACSYFATLVRSGKYHKSVTLRGNGYPGSHDDDLPAVIFAQLTRGAQVLKFLQALQQELAIAGGRSGEKAREKELSDVSVKFNTHPR